MLLKCDYQYFSRVKLGSVVLQLTISLDNMQWTSNRSIGLSSREGLQVLAFCELLPFFLARWTEVCYSYVLRVGLVRITLPVERDAFFVGIADAHQLPVRLGAVVVQSDLNMVTDIQLSFKAAHRSYKMKVGNSLCFDLSPVSKRLGCCGTNLPCQREDPGLLRMACAA